MVMRIRKPNLRSIPEDLDCDYLILDGRALWSASKNRNYRDSITNKLASIHRFLRAKGMYASNEVELA